MNAELAAAFAAAPEGEIKAIGMSADKIYPGLEDIAPSIPADEHSFVVLKSGHAELNQRTRKWRLGLGTTSVVSNKTIYVFKRGRGINLETIPAHTITSISVKKVLGFGTVVELVRAGNADRLRHANPEQAEKFASAVRELSSKPQGSSTTIVNEVDPLDQLKKLKDLLDAGILSQEEFDAKKTDIMNKI